MGERDPKNYIDKDRGRYLQKVRMMSLRSSHEDDLQASSSSESCPL
jgi:hypothetical protein